MAKYSLIAIYSRLPRRTSRVALAGGSAARNGRRGEAEGGESGEKRKEP